MADETPGHHGDDAEMLRAIIRDAGDLARKYGAVTTMSRQNNARATFESGINAKAC
jgi:hypothetical protein